MSTIDSISEQNKDLVVRFVDEIWNARRFENISAFVAEDYIQHNPNLPDGRAALEGFLWGYYTQAMPEGVFKIARMVAEGDLVVAHSLFKLNAEDRGTAVVDIYRVRGGVLVEHWDVKEPVAEGSANGNGVV